MKVVYAIFLTLSALSIQAQPFKRPYPGCPVFEHVTPETYAARTRPFIFDVEATPPGTCTIRLSAEYLPEDYGEAKWIRVIVSKVEPPGENSNDKDLGYIHNAQKEVVKTYDVALPSKDQRITSRLISIPVFDLPRAILLVRYNGRDGGSSYGARLCRFVGAKRNQRKEPLAAPSSVPPQTRRKALEP
jgi:hypothetical protein